MSEATDEKEPGPTYAEFKRFMVRLNQLCEESGSVFRPYLDMGAGDYLLCVGIPIRMDRIVTDLIDEVAPPELSRFG